MTARDVVVSEMGLTKSVRLYILLVAVAWSLSESGRVGLCRDLASGRGHKLRMSITGSLLGDACTTGKAKSLSTKLDTLITVE